MRPLPTPGGHRHLLLTTQQQFNGRAVMMLRMLFTCVLAGLSLPAMAKESAPDNTPPTFTPEQIQADFEYLYEGLQSANYDLFAIAPRGDFEARYRESLDGFVEPMTRFDAEMAFQEFVALAHQAHTRIESDYSGYRAYRAAGGAGFPLGIAVEDGQMTVTGNFSGVPEIQPGDRIRAIDGVPISELLPRLTAPISAESPEFAYVLLESYMPLVVWLELGSADAYAVTFEHADGSRGTYEISAEADTEQDSDDADKPFSLSGRDARMLTETVAYLRPGPFSNTNPGANTWDNTEFVEFVDKAFATFIGNEATQLVLDLRDNPGGNNSFSDPVIAWFADRPFRFSSDFRVKVSPQSTAANQARLDSDPDDSGSTSHLYARLYAATENGETVLFPIPEIEPRPQPRYEGEVYVLVNRYSFSNAVTTAALIQDYDFGVIMGEQTVDMATTYGAMERFTLPETGIVVAYPKALIVRPSGNDKAHPVSPDVALPSPKIRGATDVMLKAAIAYIESQASD